MGGWQKGGEGALGLEGTGQGGRTVGRTLGKRDPQHKTSLRTARGEIHATVLYFPAGNRFRCLLRPSPSSTSRPPGLPPLVALPLRRLPAGLGGL